MRNSASTIPAFTAILAIMLTLAGCAMDGSSPQPSDFRIDRAELSVETSLILDQAERGEPVGQFNLGARYDCACYDLPQNYAQALKWYRRAAAQGSYSAQFNIARMYEEGKGVRKNLAEAARWYRKSAEWDPYAQLQLGIMYSKGQGVWKNLAEAARWFREAADRRLAEAQY